MSGLLGLFRGDPQELAKAGYAALSDEALLALIFTEGARLPMEFAQEVISRGERMVPALAEAALDPSNHDRGDAGWCSAIHACFLLGEIGGSKAAEALPEAFDISDDMDNDWINEEWASIFGRLGPQVLEPLKERAEEYDGDCYFRHRAMSGMAAVALRHPERKSEVFDFIAGIASDADDDPEGRLWAGDILLDFRLKEHEGLLLALAELPENDVYRAEDVRKALSEKEPDLYWYQRDWLDFYSPENVAKRRKRWEGTQLSEDEAWQFAAKDLEDEDEGLPMLTRKQAERMLGQMLPLARRIEERMEPDSSGLSKEQLQEQYALAMELHAVVRADRRTYGFRSRPATPMRRSRISRPRRIATAPPECWRTMKTTTRPRDASSKFLRKPASRTMRRLWKLRRRSTATRRAIGWRRAGLAGSPWSDRAPRSGATIRAPVPAERSTRSAAWERKRRCHDRHIASNQPAGKTERIKVDLQKFILDFQDHLAPRLDTYEQAIYLYVFRHRENRILILKRDGGKCFYCLKQVSDKSFVLEHVVSRPNGTNSYRNLVTACRGCNNRKKALVAEDFLRLLFREGLLHEAEFAGRIEMLKKLRDGEVRPDIAV